MRIISLCLVIFLFSATLIKAGESDGSVRYKLDHLKIEGIELEKTKFSDAVAIIKDLCRKADPEGKGINISYIAPKDDKGKTIDPVIDELSLTDIPLRDLLRYVCEAAGMTYRVDRYTVIIFQKSLSGDKMETRTFKVRPDTVNSIEKKSQ